MLYRFFIYCCLLALTCLSANRVRASEYQYELLNDNDGFSSSIIFSIAQDNDGFLWFGTGFNGLMRYDGENVVAFRNEASNEKSLPNDSVGNIIFDHQGNLWIGSWGGGAIKAELHTQKFTQYTHVADSINTISSERVQVVFEDHAKQLWFGTSNDGLNKFSRESQDFIRLPLQKGETNGISHPRVWGIAQTDEDKLWLATGFGLNLLDINTQGFEHFIPEPGQVSSNINELRAIIKTPNNDLYLGTQNGVLFFDTQRRKFEFLNTENIANIGPIYEIMATDFNEYWVSTDNGIFTFSDDNKTLRKVPLGFDDSCSQSLFQDKQGTIWVSCEGVGVYKITRTSTIKLYPELAVKNAYSLEAANDGSIIVGTSQRGLQKFIPETQELIKLSSNTPPDISLITQTSTGAVWYGNNQQLFVLEPSGDEREISPPETLKSDFQNIRNIATDSQDNIWLISDIAIFKVNSESFAFSSISLKNLASSKEQPTLNGTEAYEPDLMPARGLLIGPQGTLLSIIDNTIYRVDEKRMTLVAFSRPAQTNGLIDMPNQQIIAAKSKQYGVWISTTLGLYLVDPKSGERKLYSDYFSKKNKRNIYFIHEDKQGLLWLVTTVGLSTFNPKNGDLKHLDKQDNLPGSRFFFRPTVRESDGNIFLSSRDGITYFNPSDFGEKPLNEKTILTKFEVLNLPKNYNPYELETSGLELDSNHNNIIFEFATLDLLHARQIQYSYLLEGFDDSWIESISGNTATYTNLNGGNYVFRVRAKLKDHLWYTNELAVDVSIATPFWKRWWMFIIYTGILALCFYWYLQNQKKAVIQLEQLVAKKTNDIAKESEKLASANRIKTQFLANMSHEIRTPLTTVIGQAEAIICHDIKQQDIYKEVEVIHDSSLYLLALLNDILDLTKIEANKFELDFSAQNLNTLLAHINTMFSIQAKMKGLRFSLVETLPRPFIINIDGLRLKQILINLLSNALKFTNKGYVSLEVELKDEQLVFMVKDSGIGINQDQIEQIFLSFTQGDSSIRRRFGGSGLGLHLSNQLAMLMQGSIQVKSKLGEGSVFTFAIPAPVIAQTDDAATLDFDLTSLSSSLLFDGKILLAEDHPDNRHLISRLLTKLGLTVYTAADGLEVIEIFKKCEPEIILMDIQMPKMDGLQAYRELRKLGYDKPIIALTANAMENEVEEYFSLGFDGYIQKPIDRQLLISTIATFFNGKGDDAMNRANLVLDNVDMSDLIDEFKVSLVKELEQLNFKAERREVEALRAMAHRLSGAAHLFGFSTLSQKATTLEKKIKQGFYSFDELQTDLDALADEIRQILLD